LKIRLATALCLGFAWVPTAAAEEIERLESRVPVLEEEVREACANERAGEARASLAYLTYNRAQALTQDLNREIAKLNRFLDSPEELAYRQLEEDLAQAREASRQKSRVQLDLDVQALDWMRLQAGTDRPYPQYMIDRQREKVKRAKRLLDYYSRNDAIVQAMMTPDQLRKLLSVKIGSALRQLKQMSALGRKLDAASSRAWGCWVTATNAGKMVDQSPLQVTFSIR
jgi:hypothetical protein